MQGTPAEWTEHLIAPQPTDADRDAYRAHTAAAAKGVAVVSAVQGRWDHAVTVTDYLSVSYDPPTMLVSLYSLSRIAEAVEASGRWALSVLSAEQRGIAERLGEQGAPLDGLLGQTPHYRRTPGSPALIAGAISWFELRTLASHAAATHTLFVGEVTAMGRATGFGAPPLVRFQSGYLRTR
jgi:flavin reductase (DIM6/NTAB) family NADH-FMN oxidoreductase RutF